MTRGRGSGEGSAHPDSPAQHLRFQAIRSSNGVVHGIVGRHWTLCQIERGQFWNYKTTYDADIDCQNCMGVINAICDAFEEAPVDAAKEKG